MRDGAARLRTKIAKAPLFAVHRADLAGESRGRTPMADADLLREISAASGRRWGFAMRRRVRMRPNLEMRGNEEKM